MFHFPNNLVIIYSHVLTHKRRPVFFRKPHSPRFFVGSVSRFCVEASKRSERRSESDSDEVDAVQSMQAAWRSSMP